MEIYLISQHFLFYFCCFQNRNTFFWKLMRWEVWITLFSPKGGPWRIHSICLLKGVESIIKTIFGLFCRCGLPHNRLCFFRNRKRMKRACSTLLHVKRTLNIQRWENSFKFTKQGKQWKRETFGFLICGCLCLQTPVFTYLVQNNHLS